MERTQNREGLTKHTVALARRETEDKNVTRQPKSCYATADLLTHISRKGARETGAVSGRTQHTGSPSQETETASTRPTDSTTTD